MKKTFLLSLMSMLLISALSAFADDSVPQSIKITGESADQIASLSSLAAGSSASGSFVSGKVKVICRTNAPALQAEDDTQEPEQHYTCTLSASK